jgi:hypothetical protein
MIPIEFKIDLDHEIIPNFKLHEVTCKCNCGLIIVYKPLLVCLHNLRTRYNEPIWVTSWTRCEKHNKYVGGVLNSNHLYGKAVDIRPLKHGLDWKLVSFAFEYFPRVITHWDKNYIHCDVGR